MDNTIANYYLNADNVIENTQCDDMVLVILDLSPAFFHQSVHSADTDVNAIITLENVYDTTYWSGRPEK